MAHLSTETTQREDEFSLTPGDGWHCTHLFYQMPQEVRARLALSSEEKAKMASEFNALFSVENSTRPHRHFLSLLSGGKADFGLVLMDPDPLVLIRFQRSLLGTAFGRLFAVTYSYTSISEISEYLPSKEEFTARLVREGEEEGSPGFQAKVDAYEHRQKEMKRQRLTPVFPDWPVICFYPMNRRRHPDTNWYLLNFEERARLTAEHARSGMQSKGEVTQLVTASTGLDNWEWGVTLWAKRPHFIKEIVYRMRFDEISAKYSDFGQFFIGYNSSPEIVVETLT
ncbi:MAG: chlorite dismutase family protein [Pirellulaceae bacterium]|nr:chlorite dismutase family protein [Pirellulaceae bacterium]